MPTTSTCAMTSTLNSPNHRRNHCTIVCTRSTSPSISHCCVWEWYSCTINSSCLFCMLTICRCRHFTVVFISCCRAVTGSSSLLTVSSASRVLRQLEAERVTRLPGPPMPCSEESLSCFRSISAELPLSSPTTFNRFTEGRCIPHKACLCCGTFDFSETFCSRLVILSVRTTGVLCLVHVVTMNSDSYCSLSFVMSQGRISTYL